MRDRHAHIFIEMKGGDPCPIDVFGSDEMVEHLKLGRPRGDDDVRMAALTDNLADEACTKVCGFRAGLFFVLEYGCFDPGFHFHAI